MRPAAGCFYHRHHRRLLGYCSGPDPDVRPAVVAAAAVEQKKTRKSYWQPRRWRQRGLPRRA